MTRILNRIIFALLLHAVPIIASAADDNVLWYAHPAEQWTQALPIGNGRLGAMIFGQPRKERLQLNDITVWSQGPQPNADRVDAYKSLPELRRLVRDGHYAEAEKFANDQFSGPAPYDASYQTLGDLNFEFQLPAGEIADYRRDLDISQAVAGVSFKAGDTTFSRQLFSSAPAHAIVQHLTADRPGSIGFTMSLTRLERAKTRFEPPATLIMTGDTGDTLRYEVRACVIPRGGNVSGRPDGSLRVEAADEVTIILTAATTYVPNYKAGFKGGDLSAASRQLEAAAGMSCEALKSDHVADYRRLFDRVQLHLASGSTTQPTDERLKAYRDHHDASFAALFYQFGRYLLISSSRAENPLPSNSQGLWGDGLNLPWKCDYKANINYEMNYWAAEPANLSELHLPMIRMTQNLVEPGMKTAKAYFGPDTPGWLCGYTTNAWDWTSPGRWLPWGVWFGGSAWMCQDLWEHYAFTRDADYLKSVYPTLKGASEFWLSNLVEGADGKLITSPSSSPENTFTTDDGVKSAITEGAAIERELVWDLFDNTIAACRMLGTDDAFALKLTAARDRIRPLQIGKAGQLMEWNGDWDLNASEMHHRHISHVFALFPGHQISTLATPTLTDAARKSLELRGDEGTGWSLAWKINCWARLRDGDHALRLIDDQLRFCESTKTNYSGGGGTYANLFDAHPPFQIDGNFGFVSGVDELLLQSSERFADPAEPGMDRYVIDLLPALPTEWKDGQVSGLRARGGFDISMEWREGKLMKATLRNITSQPSVTRVRFGANSADFRFGPGDSRTIDSSMR